MGRRRLAAGVAGIFFLAVPLMSILGVFFGPSVEAAPGCGDQVHYYSAEVENNFFGPKSEGAVEAQKTELHTRRCADPALVVAHAHVWGVPGFGQLNGDAQFTAKTQELVSNRDLWRATVAELERVEGQAVASIETMSGSYQTLYMVDRAGDVPLIRRDDPDRPSFQVIRFVREGTTVNLKLDCGFQPVGQFPQVPPVDNPTPTPTTTPPPTVPPPTTSTTTPPPCPPGQVAYEGRCIKAPSDDGTGGNDRPVSQPVADNPQGPTPGAPTEKPPPAVRPPGDENGGSGDGGAPAPTEPDDDSDSDQTTSPPPDGSDPCPLGPGNC